MNHCPESQRICNLAVEPDILIGGEEPSQVGTNKSNDVAKHREENEATVVGENETSAAR
jgi:hypothetical protein